MVVTVTLRKANTVETRTYIDRVRIVIPCI